MKKHLLKFLTPMVICSTALPALSCGISIFNDQLSIVGHEATITLLNKILINNVTVLSRSEKEEVASRAAKVISTSGDSSLKDFITNVIIKFKIIDGTEYKVLLLLDTDEMINADSMGTDNWKDIFMSKHWTLIPTHLKNKK